MAPHASPCARRRRTSAWGHAERREGEGGVFSLAALVEGGHQGSSVSVSVSGERGWHSVSMRMCGPGDGWGWGREPHCLLAMGSTWPRIARLCVVRPQVQGHASCTACGRCRCGWRGCRCGSCGCCGGRGGGLHASMIGSEQGLNVRPERIIKGRAGQGCNTLGPKGTRPAQPSA